MMRIFVGIALALAACSSSHSGTADGNSGSGGDGSSGSNSDGRASDASGSTARTVFVIPMENEPSSAIYGNTTNAPYINSLFPNAARAAKFQDELPALPSEPHYVWMEAGTNVFTDVTFSNDNDPSASHSTASTDHLSTQLEAAHVTWTSYQEDIAANTCPITSSGFYAAKHDPFVFFQDVVGATPSTSAPLCVAHHKPYSAFEADLAAGTVPRLVFITPNLCHDMHGASGCPSGTVVSANIKAGDTWLSTELPRILAYAQAHDSIVMLTWDEGDSSNLIPFLMLGPSVKTNYMSSVTYSHSSQLKTIEELLGVAPLAKVSAANDFADMLMPGTLP